MKQKVFGFCAKMGLILDGDHCSEKNRNHVSRFRFATKCFFKLTLVGGSEILRHPLALPSVNPWNWVGSAI